MLCREVLFRLAFVKGRWRSRTQKVLWQANVQTRRQPLPMCEIHLPISAYLRIIAAASEYSLSAYSLFLPLEGGKTVDTAASFVAVIFFAAVTQFLVDRVKEIVGPTVMKYVKPPIWAVLIGILLSILCKVDFFDMLGYPVINDMVGYILTGLIVSAGSIPVHELVSRLREGRSVEQAPENASQKSPSR